MALFPILDMHIVVRVCTHIRTYVRMYTYVRTYVRTYTFAHMRISLYRFLTPNPVLEIRPMAMPVAYENETASPYAKQK